MNNFESPSNLNIVLVRSGSTDLDDQGRITGSLDMPLSQAGEEEALATAIELMSIDIDAIYSARSLAAQQTAQALTRDGEIRVFVNESWTNLDHGLWHGKSIEELKETRPKLYRRWKENPESICPPGGETVEVVRTRVRISLKKIHKKFKGGTVAIVAPDPLFSIIRSEVDDSVVRDVLPPKPDPVRWQEIELSIATV
jgi:broad specificity phosphatase PhoE